MWRFPQSPKHCCIYRVPNRIRRFNPEAYTPQLVIIGPLHHSLKSEALKSRGDITNTKSMGYLNMEELKKIYLVEFTRRLGEIGEGTIDGFRRIIEKEEETIRESYSESTAWIQSPEFVEMVLHDSVFILEFFLRSSKQGCGKIGDPLMDEPCLQNTVLEDLILLENQLPYFILKKLFDPLFPNDTFRELVIIHFDLKDKIGDKSEFRHFTDLVRCVRVEKIPERKSEPIKQMYTAEKLDCGGVKFEVLEKEFTLYVRFENGCLKMPCLRVDDGIEMKLRNIMALEQCHYSCNTYICDFIIFLDYLIDTDKDVELLVEKGIIENWLGQHGLVAEMVNKLSLGILDGGSSYSDIADQIHTHYTSPVNKSWAILKRVYFGNLWTGTATVVATFLLLMTLIQVVTSIIQVMP
ncbi:hypothetical protein V5N11_025660 [Cardamine amara subsp. amara]|uniref:Uncharacterized protein n=1 Tax=Cardamine amara subsp. amara TaxID=228776 RepID=A0ABD0ZPQ7_CARAN